jgi:phosphatidylglycerol:prolipoprotein diacylglycerol transferase
MADRYVHDIDPVLADLGGVYLWWYGLGFALGFLQLHRFVQRDRHRLGLSAREAWSLSTMLTAGVLIGGRAVEIAFDEWPFYREHLALIPAYWLGGMATHGLLLGAAAATALFAVLWKAPFLRLADSLVIPGAFLMGVGRIGNFIDGQIVGSVTDVWWGVKFPYADGFRHPVVLYDGAKNLLLVLFLLYVRRTNPTPGAVAARFVFWYAFPRIFIDLLRDYPTHRLALGTGQTLNLVMAAIGVVLLFRSRRRRLRMRFQDRALEPLERQRPGTLSQRVVFAGLLLLCLTIPSNWTQNVPERYGARHPGLRHSWLYPAIDTNPRQGSKIPGFQSSKVQNLEPAPWHPGSLEPEPWHPGTWNP